MAGLKAGLLITATILAAHFSIWAYKSNPAYYHNKNADFDSIRDRCIESLVSPPSSSPPAYDSDTPNPGRIELNGQISKDKNSNSMFTLSPPYPPVHTAAASRSIKFCKKTISSSFVAKRQFSSQIHFLLHQICFYVESYLHDTYIDLTATVTLLFSNNSVWFWTVLSCLAIASAGIFPAFFIPETEYSSQVDRLKQNLYLNRLLSFAVGSLLGDAFFHLLPESYSNASGGSVYVGCWAIIGLLTCMIIEKICAESEISQHYAAAVTNLSANLMDNFTHGLAVAGSFLVNQKLGFLTTFAILLHEIPHEIGDFAILLKADFDRKSAVKAQLITACGGLSGACFALFFDNCSQFGASTAWILPFTAGSFISIALIQLAPDIIKEITGLRECLIRLGLFLASVLTMAALNSSAVLLI